VRDSAVDETTHHPEPNHVSQYSVTSVNQQPNTGALVIPIGILTNKQTINTHGLLDSGASGNFISSNLVKEFDIKTKKKTKPITLILADNQPSTTGSVTHETVPLDLSIEGHRTTVVFEIARALAHPVILGLPWLEANNPSINWRMKTINFPRARPRNLNSETSCRTIRTINFVIPEKYIAYSDVFSKKEADLLPMERPYDCEIPLKDEACTVTNTHDP